MRQQIGRISEPNTTAAVYLCGLDLLSSICFFIRESMWKLYVFILEKGTQLISPVIVTQRVPDFILLVFRVHPNYCRECKKSLWWKWVCKLTSTSGKICAWAVDKKFTSNTSYKTWQKLAIDSDKGTKFGYCWIPQREEQFTFSYFCRHDREM